MKVSLDKNSCMVCGSCAGLCPEVFAMQDDGTMGVTNPNPDESLKKSVIDAKDACPAAAITVEE